MLVTIFSQGNDKTKSISLHAAASKKTFILLAVLSPISMTLFIVFIIKWMAPTFNLSPVFVILSVVADVGYILAAWVPALEGRRGRLHDILAYGASLLLIPTAFILANSPNIATGSRLVNAVSVLTMLVILCVMVWHKPAKTKYLYYQIAYFLAFDISLLTAAYLS